MEKEYLTIGNKSFIVRIDLISDLVSYTQKNGDDTETNTTVTYDATGAIQHTEVETFKPIKKDELDGPKFDTVRLMFDELFRYELPSDDNFLDFDTIISKMPLGFKIAFNTLLHYDLLEEVQ